MPSYPFYFDAKEKLKNVSVELTDEQQNTRAQDRELIKAMDEYYEPHREEWRQAGALFNLIQNGTNDVTSNWYLGWARLLINHSMAMLSAGNPRGDFKPVGNHDYKMQILTSALVEHQIDKCNWKAHQRLWLEDLHTFGNGVTESYSELPMRTKKYEKGGTIVSKIVRDFRRAKVGIRRVSPFRAMRSIFITDPDDVPVSVKIEEGTWNQKVIRYDNAILPDGKKKYDTEQIPVGSHYRATKWYDENENCYRVYMLTYGGKPESTTENCPPVHELGYPIYDEPLSRYKFIDQGRTLIGGANIPGMSPLAFATFDDQLDPDMETYSVCGMGIPKIIRGPEAIMQGLVNMSIDNERLRATVPISYEPNSANSPSALDLDVRTMYSGLVIDGKITPQPLGLPSAGSSEVMYNWLKFLFYQLTGVNVEPLTGDSLSTAYQSGLLVRQMNIRSQARIDQWSGGPLKRAWTVLGANALSEVTVPEWEEITEDGAQHIAELIKSDSMTGEDFNDTEKDAQGKTVYKKRRHTMITVKGYKFREDFSGTNKKRALDFNSTDNTLIEDPTMPGNESSVPAEAKYLLPSGAVESIMEFVVTVDGTPMLRDLKTQDMEMGKGAVANAESIAAISPEFAQEVDWKKLYMKTVEPAGITEEDVFKTQNDQSEVQKAFKDAAANIQKDLFTPKPNAQQAQGLPQSPQPAMGADPRASGLTAEAGGAAAANPAIRGIAQG